MRVAVFSERLAPPFDEGIKNVAYNLLRRLRQEHAVMGLTTGGADIPELGVRDIPRVNRLLVNGQLAALLRDFRPERICYIPTASMTLFSFIRAWVLGRYVLGTPVTMVALQPRKQGALARRLVHHIAPARVIVQSRDSADLLSYLGERVRFVPAGVDTERFHPISPAEREALRRKYGLRASRPIALHVGHIHPGRNVGIMEALQRAGIVQALLVGSTSTRQDAELAQRLQSAGVWVLAEYLPAVEEMYQLADLYLFPPAPDMPAERTPAIEVPLSVLEAMACDLPVVSTRFGGLPAMFPEGAGMRYVDDAWDEDAWLQAAQAALTDGAGHTRQRVLPFGWDRFVRAVLGSEE